VFEAFGDDAQCEGLYTGHSFVPACPYVMAPGRSGSSACHRPSSSRSTSTASVMRAM
jgi:hypothetical protein